MHISGIRSCCDVRFLSQLLFHLLCLPSTTQSVSAALEVVSRLLLVSYLSGEHNEAAESPSGT